MVVDGSFLLLVLGTEQEWKLAQSTMEAASNGLYSATNELCVASLKAKSASGYIFYHQIALDLDTFNHI